jgi:signal transduction histidine kinase/CheY-like chemotaxis protein
VNVSVRPPAGQVQPLFTGPGEIHRLAASVDWAATPLGAPEAWPPALRAAVRLCLDSATPVAVWAGPAFVLVHNEAYASVLGPRHVGAMGLPADQVWPEVWEAVGNEMRSVFETGVPTRHENARWRLDRGGHEEESFYSYGFSAIREEDGRISGLFNDAEETTPLVRGRTDTEELLAFALATGRMGAVDLDLFDHTARRSAEHDRLFGHDRLLPEWTYEMFLAHVLPEDRPEVDRAFRAVLEEKRDWNVECRIRRADGEVRWIWVSGRPRLENGRPRVAGLVQDVTDRKCVEEALRETQARLEDADRRKNDFLAVLSHELRNPLTPIKNSLYLLERAPPGGDQARRAREVLDRQVDQLTRLVDDLLDVTRITRGKIQLQRSRVELNELVRRTFEDHRSQFERNALDVQLQLAPSPIHLDADPNRVAQIVGNLLVNAAKFTPHWGHVTVSIAADEAAGEAVLRVADTGAGIAPGVRDRIFEPFVQADRTLDRSKGGLGLGLALVKGLVEQHGGSVAVRSEGVGRGAEFTVRLPIATASPIGEPALPGATPISPRRVLVIEDNVDAAESLRDLLRLEGHEVAIAFDGPEGIARAREFQPELVLCDLGLPGMDGFEVARVFRADPLLAGARLVALSGYALPEDVQRAMEAGFAQHVAKPPTREKLEGVFAWGA